VAGVVEASQQSIPHGQRCMSRFTKQLVEDSVGSCRNVELTARRRNTGLAAQRGSGRCPVKKRVLLEGPFAFALVFTPHELCRRKVEQDLTPFDQKIFVK
jgi:hypothetical protein